MNTQLKKGDKITSQWGVLTLNEDKGKGDFVSVTLESGEVKLMRTKELDRLLTKPQSDMPLKKGDKCQSPYGIAEIHSFGVEACLLKLPDGSFRSMFCDKLTRIPTRAERMQAVLEIAWDVENRLQDDETVQLKVGAFVEFARQFVKMRDVIEESINADKYLAGQFIESARLTEKLLKGETL